MFLLFVITLCCGVVLGNNAEDLSEPVPPPLPPSDARFNWAEQDVVVNDQPVPDEEMLLNDEATMMLHPKNVLSSRTNRLSKFEKDAKKDKKAAQLVGPEGKLRGQQEIENKTADNDELMQNDKGDDALRQMYYWANYNHYNYPTSSAYMAYGYPGVMALTDSQINWINSLPADMRDHYLRNYHVVRAGSSVDSSRVQALRHYQDMYNYYNYYAPYYTRQPVSVSIEDATSSSDYDYSCNQANSYFLKAPKLPNAYVSRYDARQNSRRGHYLAAVYRCNTGYEMLDTRYTELYCSRRNWVGTQPVCVRRS